MKTIATHQPNYIPWLGYFYKIYQSDIFVFLDDVQFSKKGMHNYHYIKSSEGPIRIKIPVTHSYYDKINAVKISDGRDWRRDHLKLLETNYKNAPYFQEVYSDFEKLLVEGPKEMISDLNITIIEFICNKLGIPYEFKKSSELNINSVKEERIIDICKALDGEVYLSGTGAKAYQEEVNFNNNGLQLKYSEYKIFNYPQQFGDFQSNVTILDFLMNCGYDWDSVLKRQQ